MSATSLEIESRLWAAYLTSLSKQYENWQVTVEVLRQDVGDQRVIDGLGLLGLSFETKGSEAGDILVEAGDLPAPFMIHQVDKPRRLHTANTRPGAETDIRIESEDGTVTLVILRSRPRLPPPDGSTR